MDETLEEIEKQIFALKAKRQELQRSQPRPEVNDYRLLGPDGTELSLRSLFGDKKDLLVVHNMGRGCSYCTLWADGFNGLLPHIESRTAFVLVSPNAPDVQAEFAAGRGWKFLMASDASQEFTRDMGFAVDDDVYPGVSAFHMRSDGKIERVAYSWFGPGDDFCSVFPLFELLADGVGDWGPEFTYERQSTAVV